MEVPESPLADGMSTLPTDSPGQGIDDHQADNLGSLSLEAPHASWGSTQLHNAVASVDHLSRSGSVCED